MAVNKVFWDDPYLREIEARVISVNGDVVTLDRTIFYAFCGGQASDSGSIGGFEVIEAKRCLDDIHYTLANHRLSVGDRVMVRIDWEKRYRIMRLHFAAELVLELVYQHFGRPSKIGANITSDKARLDFLWDGNISEIFPVILSEAQGLIHADCAIKSDYSDREHERRYWEIDGFARVACGGTHIRRTGDIGGIRLSRKSLGRGKERIEIFLVS